MEKKATTISLIFVSVVVLSAVALIIFMGITAREYNYVQLEVNPKVEFIVDKKFKAVSYRPLNDDGLVVLANENLKGLDIEDACVKYLDICSRLGYIDVDGIDNAVNLTIIDGLTQALDTHICEGIFGYLKDNEIVCSVTENADDRASLEGKKKENLCCSNKYKLISTICEMDDRQDFDDLKKLSEIELIDIVTNIHQTKHFVVTQEAINKKAELEQANASKYTSHMEKITNSSKSEFATLLEKFQIASTKNYKLDFEKEYTNWQESGTN